ncbi:MAG: primosomal protein N', partial [bacterium]
DTVEGRKAEAPQLTRAQLKAVAAIEKAVVKRAAQSFLLFGVTGSGKTEVFLHAIARALEQGRQAIVLVPEISLTAQAMALYHGRFPHQVAVLHSHLSAGERYDEWMRIARGEARVILGARSAIFAPCDNVGLIVIDEEHESSYKQESSPRYHARTVAMERGRQHDAPVILASATPSLESMREAETGIHTLLELPARIGARPMPKVRLVDLRKMTKGAHILSAPLRDAISARLAAGEQTILFLNRRGWSYALLCSKCGHQEMCPNCNLTLTYHKASGVLRCHHCDHLIRAQAECPKCKGPVIAFKGVGTERLQEEVRTAWPTARLGRMDRDSTAHKGAHQEILDKFDRLETDILIGTQMVAKGLDFPRVTLVGVISADTSLAIPDFRAPERTFQLLTQVAGRAGRAEWAGEVFVQTFQPFHYAIEAAAQQDYALFYAQELLARAEAAACWPPLTALINVLVIGAAEDEVSATATALARRAREEGAAENLLPPMDMTPLLPNLFEQLQVTVPEGEEEIDPFGITEVIDRDIPPPVSVDGPTPCSLPRLRGEYRYHLVLRGQDRPALRAVARALRGIEPPKSVRVIIDVDPLSLA